MSDRGHGLCIATPSILERTSKGAILGLLFIVASGRSDDSGVTLDAATVTDIGGVDVVRDQGMESARQLSTRPGPNS